MKALAARFIEESSLELHSFLSHDLARTLEAGLRNFDSKDGLDGERQKRIPPHSAGENGAWAIKGPPHKWRYCVLKRPVKGAPVATVRPLARSSVNDILRSLQDELFPSPPFRAWLTLVSRLMPLRCRAEARRFRPGLDYSLATSEDKEARLDVVLGLTPEVKSDPAELGWTTGEWGGWEVGTLRNCLCLLRTSIIHSAIWRLTMRKMTLPYTVQGLEKSGKKTSIPTMCLAAVRAIPDHLVVVPAGVKLLRHQHRRVTTRTKVHFSPCSLDLIVFSSCCVTKK